MIQYYVFTLKSISCDIIKFQFLVIVLPILYSFLVSTVFKWKNHEDHNELQTTKETKLLSPVLGNYVLYCLIFLFICYLGVICYYIGRSTAENRTEFQVIAPSSDVPEVAVLRISGDYLLTAPFDRVTKKVEKKLYILKISEMPKTPLTLENIGPLSVKP